MNRCQRHARRGAARAPLLLFVAVVGCGGAARRVGEGIPAAPAGSYPAWFLDTPDGDYAAGYSQQYYYEDSSLKAATRLAAYQLAAEESVTIQGGKIIVLTAMGALQPGSDLREEVGDDRVNALDKEAHRVAEARGAKMVFILLGRGEPSDETRNAFRDRWAKCPEKRPDWLTNLPNGSEYVYEIGVAGNFFYEESSWKAAEQHARLNLARRFPSEVKYEEHREDSRYLSRSEVTIRATLRGARIVKRWRDPKSGNCYVLAKARR